MGGGAEGGGQEDPARHVEQSRDARKGDGPAACYLDGPLGGGGFLNPSAFISRIHLPKSPQRALVKGREFVCHIESAASASANVVALPWY